MRPVLWAPVVLLCMVAGVLGWRWGIASLTIDEGAAIAAVAQRHAANVPEARPAHCAATPGEGPVWIVVACTTQGATRVYPLDRRGRIIERDGV